jgi:hypothetical protein
VPCFALRTASIISTGVSPPLWLAVRATNCACPHLFRCRRLISEFTADSVPQQLQKLDALDRVEHYAELVLR